MSQILAIRTIYLVQLLFIFIIFSLFFFIFFFSYMYTFVRLFFHLCVYVCTRILLISVDELWFIPSPVPQSRSIIVKYIAQYTKPHTHTLTYTHICTNTTTTNIELPRYPHLAVWKKKYENKNALFSQLFWYTFASDHNPHVSICASKYLNFVNQSKPHLIWTIEIYLNKQYHSHHNSQNYDEGRDYYDGHSHNNDHSK